MGFGDQPGGAAPAMGLGDLGTIDYAWLQEQLAELSKQLSTIGLEDEFEDEYEEWEDPSGGLLSEIFDACENDDAGALQALLDKLKASEWGIDTHGPDGDTPLHTAALYGSEECVKVLLAAGARVDALNSEDATSVLHDAAAGGYATILRLLVDAARDQLAGGGGGAAAAGEAEGEQQRGEREEGSKAEEGGAAVGGEAAAAEGEQGKEEEKGEEEEGAAAAGKASKGEGEEEAEEEAAAPPPAPPRTLLALVNCVDSEGETALHNAARGGHVEAVRLLLALGADPSIAARDGSLAVDEPEDDGVAAIIQEAMNAAGGGDADAAAGGEGAQAEEAAA
ncbi:hypothetical protein Rsub_03922 [Raphidocelis subcapitata]|uniref:Uncharacterized protein n=1 Tax=Raphidocelis subcapitata TaxID=307507 RepID=A0A2V0NTW0_9CHLO|nr:hypothetical protein Rsub_03922 [Raphidocelis subcapitata]|eukprot:GBF91066.1 hypothetical protein Rsub_03922 [Raphidocelis subcapitata]